MQWGSASILNDQALLFRGLDLIDSVDSAQFVPDIFTTQPEFGYWLAHDGALKYDSSLALSVDQSKTLLKQARDDYRTLLNPDNIRDFLDYYESGSYAQIMHRFRLTSKR